MRLPVPLRRVGYRLAYALLRIYWFIFRPRGGGVKCVLTGSAGVLLVRHTYGPRYWDLPGGTLKSGEPPRVAATREMQEELGITIDDWSVLGELRTRIHHRHDALHCFQARIDSTPLTVDRGEIAATQWFESRAAAGRPRALRQAHPGAR